MVYGSFGLDDVWEFVDCARGDVWLFIPPCENLPLSKRPVPFLRVHAATVTNVTALIYIAKTNT